MAGGRPTKFKPEYLEVVLDKMGNEGKSITQVARDLGVSRQTIYQWVEDVPEFSDVLETAKDWSEAYWEDQFVGFMTSKEVNAPLVKLYYANRFKWSDKGDKEEDEQSGTSMSISFEVREPVKDVVVTNAKSE